MTVEFVKAHRTNDGKYYGAGQIVDIADEAAARELIRQGVAKARTGETEVETFDDDDEEGGLHPAG